MAEHIRAIWNIDCDCILVECLEGEKANGKGTSNGGFHLSAWTATEIKLAGTELTSGELKKTADSCQNRWKSVSNHLLLLQHITNFDLQLKSDYNAVKQLRDNLGAGISGFGWDDTLHIVTASDSVWSALTAVCALLFILLLSANLFSVPSKACQVEEEVISSLQCY